MIDNSDIDRLKEIFVTRKECDEIQDKVNEYTHSIDKRLAIIENNSNKNQWLLKTILGAVITLVIGAVWTFLTKGG